jgi:hypothetical protein
MSQEPEVKAAIISSKSGVWIAIIGLIGGLLIAILTPFAAKWANRSEPSPNPAYLAIETLPMTVFVYDGRAENVAGWANLSISYFDSAPTYYFDYSVPSNQAGYAGIAFRFNDGQNFSTYQTVEFTIKFDDGEPEHVVDFYLTDISDKKSHIRVTELGHDEKKESELLSNFAGVNLNAIKEITFNTDNSFITGGHKANISAIHFVP